MVAKHYKVSAQQNANFNVSIYTVGKATCKLLLLDYTVTTKLHEVTLQGQGGDCQYTEWFENDTKHASSQGQVVLHV